MHSYIEQEKELVHCVNKTIAYILDDAHNGLLDEDHIEVLPELVDILKDMAKIRCMVEKSDTPMEPYSYPVPMPRATLSGVEHSDNPNPRR